MATKKRNSLKFLRPINCLFAYRKVISHLTNTFGFWVFKIYASNWKFLEGPKKPDNISNVYFYYYYLQFIVFEKSHILFHLKSRENVLHNKKCVSTFKSPHSNSEVYHYGTLFFKIRLGWRRVLNSLRSDYYLGLKMTLLLVSFVQRCACCTRALF